MTQPYPFQRRMPAAFQSRANWEVGIAALLFAAASIAPLFAA